MLRLFSILSVICSLVLLTTAAKADSFLLADKSDIINTSEEHIIPLVYIKELEFYNHKKTSAYTKRIADKLSLEPKIIITDNESMADFYIIPHLLQSKMEPMNQSVFRYNMSVKVEFWSKGGILIAGATQNRYIVIEDKENAQNIAKKLLIKLLDDSLEDLLYKIKNNSNQTI
jgi:hypothetical protein